ncbi:MAG: tyrosine-type recombinase/integrase [Nitrososphaerota archaeon]|nr:tyrosine-type recombinase/integrase [Nitrososphaerota archaeon]
MRRFLGKYGNLRTRLGYTIALGQYFGWLKAQGVKMDPDELVKDNPNCVFRSEPVDVQTKRRHTDWLDRYVNGVLKGSRSDSLRRITAAVVMFYKRNDSPLFGDFQVSMSKPVKPAPALPADETRRVLKAMPLAQRLPLLCVWRSSMEINRVLSLAWQDVDLTAAPSMVEIFGRKGHRRPYSTFLGRDSVEGLKAWRTQWGRMNRREPEPSDLIFIGKGGKPMDEIWLNIRFRGTALALAAGGAVKTANPRSWHSHALRHSFKTEAEHLKVKSSVIEYWMGHTGGSRRCTTTGTRSTRRTSRSNTGGSSPICHWTTPKRP